jgi:hypothetical protein
MAMGLAVSGPAGLLDEGSGQLLRASRLGSEVASEWFDLALDMVVDHKLDIQQLDAVCQSSIAARHQETQA